MNFSLGHRAAASHTKARRIRSVTNLPLNLLTSIPRRHPAHVITTRNLWWWSRRATEWTDEDLEERMQRRQKIMRYRYSKALRRRAMWEGEDSHSFCGWPFSRGSVGSRWTDYKFLSSGRGLCASLQDRGKLSEQERPWKEWDRDLEKLKAKIDDAVDRDPYGTIFGRYLKSPPSSNNSSWTSFSWIYGPLRSGTTDAQQVTKNEEKGVNMESPVPKSPGHAKFSVPPSPPRVPETENSGRVEEDYEFDPISMRKVPKRKETSSTKPAPKKPFLQSLFSEHGIDIPVKTYKPHKVYGYGGPASTEPIAARVDKPKLSGKGFESSRQRELLALKAVTLGTNIDTTAEYWGKYKNEADAESALVEKPQRGARNVEPEADDSAPLFTGTTYEAISKDINLRGVSRKDWLVKEGFQTLPEALNKTTDEGNSALSRTEPKDSTSKIQPSLDRMKATDVRASSPKNIQPSLDRIKATDVRSRISREQSDIKKARFADRGVDVESSEDIDLLRASDVRAATRSARKTIQELQQDRARAREVLESDYAQRQILDDTVSIAHKENSDSTPKSVVQRSLNNVWKHIKEYPEGVVARTINSMGIFNDRYKSYVRTDKPLTDSTEKLVFKDQSLSKTPSIYKKVAKGPVNSTFTPSQEVIDAENAHKTCLQVMRQTNEEIRRKAALESRRAEGLATEIRSAYEVQYGPITVNHRQQQDASSSSPAGTARREISNHPLHTASVKPGVPRYFVIEKHVSEFEPELARLVDGTKHIRMSLHEASLQMKAIKSQRPPTHWNAQPLRAREEGPAPTVKVDQQTIVVPAIKPSDPPGKIDGNTLPMSTYKATEIPDASKAPASYIILAYDPSTDSVQRSPMNSSMSSAIDESCKTNVLQILAKLAHPAKFMPQFEVLASQGYEIASGSGDVIVFKRSKKAALVDENQIAVEEAAAQPMQQQNVHPKMVATVLDELPGSGPTPGPSAPTAPPSVSSTTVSRPKVRRQEEVFSASKTSRVSRADDSSVAKTTQEEPRTEERSEGVFKRFRRGVRRVFFTAVAMGGGAYAIGVVAESLGAEQPRVVHAGRPGIYSTESSR